MLRAGRDDAAHLAQAILDVKDKLGLCSVCNNISDRDSLPLLFRRAPRPAIVCVVEEPHNIVERHSIVGSKLRASSKAAATCCTARSRRSAALVRTLSR